MTNEPVPPVAIEIRNQVVALHDGLGFAEVSERAQVELTGKDRARLLHGLCTNDIKGLQPGHGCEAFLTSGQGKTIGYLYVFCGPDSLILDSVPGTAAGLIRDLDRYVIREDVQFADLHGRFRQFLMGGAQAGAVLQERFGISPPARLFDHLAQPWQGTILHCRRVPFTGHNSFFVAIESAGADRFRDALQDAGGSPCDPAAVEMARVEAGSPWFGQDITPENLPQEIARNQAAISFTKGCYLGQETIARLDAMGHVNKTLCGLRFTGAEVPPVGGEIALDGKTVCRLTSAAWSVRLNQPLALGFVRRSHHAVGTRLASPWGEAEVVSLPLV